MHRKHIHYLVLHDQLQRVLAAMNSQRRDVTLVCSHVFDLALVYLYVLGSIIIDSTQT